MISDVWLVSPANTAPPDSVDAWLPTNEQSSNSAPPALSIAHAPPRLDAVLLLSSRAIIINHQSSINNHHPSSISHHPSIINHQSSIINHHQSSIINHQSSIIIHQSSSINQQPSIIGEGRCRDVLEATRRDSHRRGFKDVHRSSINVCRVLRECAVVHQTHKQRLTCDRSASSCRDRLVESKSRVDDRCMRRFRDADASTAASAHLIALPVAVPELSCARLIELHCSSSSHGDVVEESTVDHRACGVICHSNCSASTGAIVREDRRSHGDVGKVDGVQSASSAVGRVALEHTRIEQWSGRCRHQHCSGS